MPKEKLSNLKSWAISILITSVIQVKIIINAENFFLCSPILMPKPFFL